MGQEPQTNPAQNPKQEDLRASAAPLLLPHSFVALAVPGAPSTAVSARLPSAEHKLTPDEARKMIDRIKASA